jgi:hypothetical protein
MLLNHQFFREKLFNFTNKVFDLVSTIDHPYSSPPIRLIDGHYKLSKLSQKGLTPYICIWDVNKPNLVDYRYELILDTGIFNTRDRRFFIFDDQILYPLQKPKIVNFEEVQKMVDFILTKLEIKKGEIFLDNLRKLICIYQRNIQCSSNATTFYKNLLLDLYTLLGLDELRVVFDRYAESYFWSRIITDWIPFCIEETRQEIFGLPSLIKKGLFQKICFRPLTNYRQDEINMIDLQNNLDRIVSMLRNRILIPSYEIFFWTLALADIRHFGNDYGFFQRLNQICPFLSNNLQLTQHNQDSIFIVQFKKDRSFNCFLRGGKYILKKNNPTKITRINSITAIFCHMNHQLNGTVQKILQNKIPIPYLIEMGNVC